MRPAYRRVFLHDLSLHAQHLWCPRDASQGGHQFAFAGQCARYIETVGYVVPATLKGVYFLRRAVLSFDTGSLCANFVPTSGPLVLLLPLPQESSASWGLTGLKPHTRSVLAIFRSQCPRAPESRFWSGQRVQVHAARVLGAAFSG